MNEADDGAGRVERDIDLFPDSVDHFDRLTETHAARPEPFVFDRRVIGHIGEPLVFGAAP